jgi:hypothetical protein
MMYWDLILVCYGLGLAIGWVCARMYYGEKLRAMSRRFFNLARFNAPGET